MTFNVGDTVRLKSGGPLMTLDAFDTDKQRWVCVWFDRTDRMQGEFLEATLEAAIKPTAVRLASNFLYR